jgi:hypothetical protein
VSKTACFLSAASTRKGDAEEAVRQALCHGTARKQSSDLRGPTSAPPGHPVFRRSSKFTMRYTRVLKGLLTH